MDYAVRPYNHNDYDFAWALHIKENGPYINRHTTYSMDEVKTWFDILVEKQLGFIIESKGQKIGCYFLDCNDEYTKLNRFFLIEEAQGKGLGSRILENIFREFIKPDKEFRISVLEDNPVQKFWLSKGFIAVSTDEDHLTLMKYQPEITK